MPSRGACKQHNLRVRVCVGNPTNQRRTRTHMQCNAALCTQNAERTDPTTPGPIRSRAQTTFVRDTDIPVMLARKIQIREYLSYCSFSESFPLQLRIFLWCSLNILIDPRARVPKIATAKTRIFLAKVGMNSASRYYLHCYNIDQWS